MSLIFFNKFVNAGFFQFFQCFINGFIIIYEAVCNRIEIFLFNCLHLCIFGLYRSHIECEADIFLRKTSFIPIFVCFNLLIGNIARPSFEINIVWQPGFK